MTASGINGQGMLEGVLMKNSNKYALAVRKPNNDIEVLVERFNSISEKHTFFKLPFIRGIINFFEGLYLGCKNFFNLSRCYDKADDKETAGKSELLQLLIVIAVISLSIGIFIVLPYGLSLLFAKVITSGMLLTLVEGAMRLVLLALYIIVISMIPDIKRFYMYLGASHKVMNCVDKKIPLIISNVRRMSRKTNGCMTVFLFTVMLLSAVLFMFIRLENTALRIAIRLLIIPVVASLVYEARELSGKIKNPVTMLFNLPAIMVQAVISDEPGEAMIEVAIKSASAVLGEEIVIAEEIKEVTKVKKKKSEAEAGIKRVSRQKQADNKTKSKEASEIKQIKAKEMSERTKLAVNNKEDKKEATSLLSEDEDDEILNALNHFFNSKKEEEKKGKRR